MPTDPSPTDIAELPQLGARRFWTRSLDARLDGFAALRRHAPVTFHEEGRTPGSRPGFWSVTRYDDVEYVSRNPALFSSAKGFTVDDLPPEMLEVLGSMIAMDDPRHARLRRLVLKAFSARTVSGLEPAIARRAEVIVDGLLERGECDFVEVAAGPYPLQVICDLVGVPAELEPRLRAWTDEIVGVSDPAYAGGPAQRGGGMYSFALEFGARRRDRPMDDLTSALMGAEIDGERISPTEFAAFLVLLVAAGNETTRTSLSWALHLLTTHPDQHRALWDDFEGGIRGATDEIVRWCSPIQHMRRTATADTTIAGVDIAQGDKVIMWYGSANHDEARFPHARRFDITRENAFAQVGFGAGGPHHCLGVALAKLEIKVLLDEIRRRAPHLHSTAEPTPLVSAFANGITALPCAVR